MKRTYYNPKVIMICSFIGLFISLLYTGFNALFQAQGRRSVELLLVSTLIITMINYSAWALIYRHMSNKLNDVLEEVRSGEFSKETIQSASDSLLKFSDETVETLDVLQTNIYEDELTGLPNRAALIQHFDTAIKTNHELLHYICLFDIDDFKEINDTHGHDTGDNVLTTIGERSKYMLLPGERLFRLGGDEFVLVSSIKSDERYCLYTTKLNAMFVKPFDVCGRELSIHISYGSSQYGLDGTELTQLLKHADDMMYVNKNSKKQLDIIEN
ncbi:GGDEF domain-containing protein [Macrococcus lamae]|uniref:GGDEF domain-containing protein n=1 Tax=Macrococcus lamae TaxID=198484 RepID=A0A4R6BU55_9STAP|nr:GGDEF domain-containing protein [Macrococcus lamae]TDM10568.1 GGDEF domain-containing protein [Macrococcus lamae]